MSAGVTKSTDSRSPAWASVGSLTAKVPVSDKINPDQQPTLLWLLEVGKVAVKVALNAALPVEAVGTATSHPLLLKLDEFEKRLEATILHKRITGDAPDVIGETPLTLKSVPEKVDSYEDLAKEIGEFLDGIQANGLSSVGVQAPTERPIADAEPLRSLQDYKDIFRVIALPDVANEFQTDACFAKYRIAGPNPMLLKGIKEAELIHLVGNRISDSDLNAILGTEGDSIFKAGNSGRLCVINFRSLSGLDPVVIIGRSFVTDPIAVFVEPLTGDAVIRPVAIQLGQDAEHSPLILANTTDIHRWQIAKSIVQVADASYHELVAHLAHTHLIMEAFSIATQRNLDADHPIHRLLAPHIEGTTFINSSAATQLIATNGPIDGVFSNDRPSRLRSLQVLAVNERFAFNFEDRMPDKELHSRNISNLKLYPYRDDALLIWDAVKHWAHAYVDLYYADDDAVIKDVKLNAWAMDICQNADIHQFAVPKTKDQLMQTLAMIIFTASAQHAAVNFPQQPMMTFAPVMTGAIWSTMPPADRPATEQEWLKQLPPIELAQEQLGLLYILGGVRYRRLGEYHSNQFPYWGTLESKTKEALQAFNHELKAIETIIKARNEHREQFGYEFLLPSLIPASVNI